jgi:hypothetical protein
MFDKINAVRLNATGFGAELYPLGFFSPAIGRI